MMQPKLFEILDHATCLPVLCVRLDSKNESEKFLLSRTGYGRSSLDHQEYILMMALAGGTGRYECDPYSWNDRTRQSAHFYISENWNELNSGDVIDVEFILDEKPQPKKSDRFFEVI